MPFSHECRNQVLAQEKTSGSPKAIPYVENKISYILSFPNLFIWVSISQFINYTLKIFHKQYTQLLMIIFFTFFYYICWLLESWNCLGYIHCSSSGIDSRNCLIFSRSSFDRSGSSPVNLLRRLALKPSGLSSETWKGEKMRASTEKHYLFTNRMHHGLVGFEDEEPGIWWNSMKLGQSDENTAWLTKFSFWK